MTIKEFRLRLKHLALELEMLDVDKSGLLSMPDHLKNEMTNMGRDFEIEIVRLKKKAHNDYMNSR